MNAPGLNVVAVKFTPSTELFTTKPRYLAALEYVNSMRAIDKRLPGEPAVFRFLDLDCGAGEFLMFAALRWPYAWIDAYALEPKLSAGEGEALEEMLPRARAFFDEERKLSRLNAQPGTRFLLGLPRPLPACDALHVGLGAFGALHFTSTPEEIERGEGDAGARRCAALQLIVHEWDSSYVLENAVGMMNAIGFTVKHVQTIKPGRGWLLGWRTKPYEQTQAGELAPIGGRAYDKRGHK